MKILSLFDGMACGMLAMQGVGVPIDSYVAFEKDPHAVQTSTHNFPTIDHRGDVFPANFSEFRGFDFLIGGSPCTFWSIAQKNNRETEATGMGWELFQQYARALREAQPTYFIYENNKSMSVAIKESISSTFGFEPTLINSALVSAQTRQRLYWVGRRDIDGTYRPVSVSQPDDRGLLIKDVLDGPESTRVPEYGASGKSRPVTACYMHKGDGEGSLATEAFPVNPNKQVRDYVAEPVRVGALPRPNGEISTSQAFRVYSISGKSVNLTAGGGGAGGKTGLYAVPLLGHATPCAWDENGKPVKATSGSDGKSHAVYEVRGGQITIKGRKCPIRLPDGFYIIRKLTVAECKRLQTVPDSYEFPVSNAQAYKMLGNGWTIEVIKHLILAALADGDDAWLL